MKTVSLPARIIPTTQICMALIYLMFGGLKLLWLSPASDLVLQATAFLWLDRFYDVLGVREVVLWLMFLHLGVFRKVWFWLFVWHMIGTFIPFVTAPELCVGTCASWEYYTLTLVWQYIIKNVSLICCALVLKFSSSD